MSHKLVLGFNPSATVLARANSEFDVFQVAGPGTVAQIVELAVQNQASALLVNPGQVFGANEIARLPLSVKIVATCSVGYDHLDVGALRARGIWATNTPDVLTDATADLTLYLILAACRRARDYAKLIDTGWGRKLEQGEMLGTDLAGKTLGILGMGRIGQAVAKRARAFGMQILYCNRNPLSADLELGAQYYKNFRAMLPRCQILSLHAPGTGETENIVGPSEFALLPVGAVFINVARGSLVNEEALFAALESKHLFAAGVDVCRNEPNPDTRFQTLPNVLVTPHVGSATQETRFAMGMRALDNIRMALQQKSPGDRLAELTD